MDDPDWSGDGSCPGAQWACWETKKKHTERQEKREKKKKTWIFGISKITHCQDLFEKCIGASTMSTKSLKVAQITQRTSHKVGEQLWRSAVVYMGDALISQQ